MHSPSRSLVPAPCSSGISILFDLLQKATLYTPVADYLFDFHSQGLITVHSFTASSPLDVSWLLFFKLFGRVLTFSVIYSKFY